MRIILKQIYVFSYKKKRRNTFSVEETCEIFFNEFRNFEISDDDVAMQRVFMLGKPVNFQFENDVN